MTTYKLLQREPTPEMKKAGDAEYRNLTTVNKVFSAMWDEAPSVEGCKLHPVAQVLTWADDYAREGGHALIVEMLRSYAALLAAPQPAQAQEALDVAHIIKLAEQWLTLEPSKGGTIINGGIGYLIEFAHAVRAADQPQPAEPMDWPLPCDVTVGAGTIKKGVALRVLVKRMELLHSMAVPQPAAPDIDALAQFIRSIDGNNTMGAGALAERICEWLPAASVSDKDADYADLYRFVRDRGCNVAWAAIGAGECLEEFDKTIRSAMAQQAGKKDY